MTYSFWICKTCFAYYPTDRPNTIQIFTARMRERIAYQYQTAQHTTGGLDHCPEIYPKYPHIQSLSLSKKKWLKTRATYPLLLLYKYCLYMWNTLWSCYRYFLIKVFLSTWNPEWGIDRNSIILLCFAIIVWVNINTTS